ncbi:hypothetical protein [Dietzia sp. ANT_WB102]|uniref:hypothetical protein n=1 Tax=Dietzia sp. ANT_WB102 TaxID=2597345 RepID=UPI0011ECD7CC|nr:hypothetical protein [Dietzia sp. ANT_WB102]KAA0916545.1 hypothetical protein FQ137_15150 [Dietzia sp. ANT_WB102]
MGPGSSSGSLGGGDAGSLAVGSLGLSALTIGGIIYGINTGAIPLPQIDMPPLPPALGLLLSQQNEVAGRLRRPPVHAWKTVEANPHLIDGPSPLGEAGRRRRPPPCGE